MKKVLGLVFVFLLLQTSVVGAQTRGINKLENYANQESVKQRVETKLSETHKKNVRHLFTKMLAKLTSTSTRLANLIIKIETKIAEILVKNPNVNLNQAKIDLQSAKENLVQVDTNIDNLKIQLENLVVSGNPSGEFLELKGLVDEVKKDLKETHRLLTKTIVNIKRIERTTK